MIDEKKTFVNKKSGTIAKTAFACVMDYL